MTIQEKATAIVAKVPIVTLASIDEEGYPRPAVLSKLGIDGASIYVATGTSSSKTAHFKSNPKAGLSIVDGHDSIIYTGTVEIVDDLAAKQAVWSDWLYEHFPAGVGDPEYALLRFTPLTATYWIDGEFVKERL